MTTISTLIGRVLQGRYRLDDGLGTGASAHVLLAFDLELQRHVAVKLFHPGLANDEKFFPRFRAEARAAAALNHPNIVQIHDWGRDGDEPFLILEYLAGGSLRSLLDIGAPLGVADVAQIGAQTANGLAFAHSRGLVHRDIKPANLLFDDAGVVHVADFGLARALVDASWTEPIGMVFGTARYASPEQAIGTNVTDRSDVYSLALVCYEALVGEAPFHADTPLAMLMARVNSALPPSPKLGPLEPVLAAATSIDPSVRLGAAEFARELERFSSTASVARLHATRPPGVTPDVDRTQWPPIVDPNDETATIPVVDSVAADPVASDPVASDPFVDGPTRLDRVRSWQREHQRLVRRSGLILLAVLLIVGGSTAFVRFGVYGQAVPKLQGMTTTSAERLVRSAGLRVDHVTRRYSTSVGAGDVIAQSLKPGTHVRSGTKIDLVLSRGHAPVKIPTVAGMTLVSASGALVKDGFVVKVARSFNETVGVADVIASVPGVRSAPFGSTVRLEISRGPRPRTIPDLSGLSYAQARSALIALRLVPARSRDYSNDVPVGEVMSSEPASGATGIPVGTKVTVLVSRGPLLVAVPIVSGDAIATAIAALQAAGLQVTEQVGPPFATTATSTDPAPGSMVQPGTNVTLYVA